MVTETKALTEAINQLHLRIKKLSEELAETKNELKCMNQALIRIIEQNSQKTYEERVAAFKAYQEGTPDA